MTISTSTSKIFPMYQTMTGMATRLIRERVLTGHYKSGTRLIPEKLEVELGLGRVAIREALRELTGSGLMVSLPNKGVIVADPPGLEEITALYQARYALEGEAALRATTKITPEAIKRLEGLLAQMENSTRYPFDMVLLNREFHLIIYEASGWKTACRIINQLFDQTLIFRSLNTSWVGDKNAGEYHKDHRGIIEALRSGNAEVAKHRVIANISRGFKQFALNQPSLKIKTKKTTE